MRDSDVRAAMRMRLDSRHSQEPDTRIVEEMNVWSGSARIDMAVINGELIGYEIKSDRDDLERLDNQIEIYNRVFDRVCLVVGSKHVEEARKVIPSWWGVLEVIQQNDTLSFRPLKKGRRNPEQDPLILVELLRKEEIIQILDSLGLANGYRSKKTRILQQRLVQALPLKELGYRVREALRARKGWLGQKVPNNLDMPIDGESDPLF